VNAEYLDLSYLQVGIATSLVLLCGAISLLLGMKLERTLLLAAARTVVQLLLVGLVLRWVFSLQRWYLVLGLMLFMTVVAAASAVGRNERRFRGIWLTTLVSVWASSWVIAAFAVFGVLQDVDPWYSPQYTIPILGMILGNTLNGISLGLSSLVETLIARRDEIDGLLALGATRWEASRDAVRHAARTGTIPIINSMMVVGLVSLPGMMTGQLLAGVAPLQAVRYQIVIMFLVAAATALGTLLVIVLAHRRLFSDRHQLLRDRIRQK